jgi:hypothetical protein
MEAWLKWKSICKALVYFYKLAMTNPKTKLRKQFTFISIKRIKWIGINLTKMCTLKTAKDCYKKLRNI